MARGCETCVIIPPQSFLAAAVMVLLIPFHWLTAWAVAAMMHELCHCLAVYLCGERIRWVRVGVSGMQMEAGNLTGGKAVICSLAGPVGGLMLLFVSGRFPRLAVCGLLQSAYNLIPIEPLDGGCVLRGLMGLVLKERAAAQVCKAVEVCVLAIILLLGMIAGILLKWGFLLIMLAVFFCLRLKKIKIPCK